MGRFNLQLAFGRCLIVVGLMTVFGMRSQMLNYECRLKQTESVTICFLCHAFCGSQFENCSLKSFQSSSWGFLLEPLFGSHCWSALPSQRSCSLWP